MIWLNKPTSIGGDDLEKIHHQKAGVQRVIQKKLFKLKSSNIPKSYSLSSKKRIIQKRIYSKFSKPPCNQHKK